MYDVLHIGQHKCASTYLQRTGLASHPEIDLICHDHKQLSFELVDYGFDFDIEAFKRAIKTTPIKNQKSNATKKVFSHEVLCGDAHTGAGARQIADLCYEVFGRIKTLLIVREPYSMIYSCWNQYAQSGGVLSLRDFLTSSFSPAQPTLLDRHNIWKKVQHHRLVSYWISRVGKDRFGVFLLEDLITNPDDFHRALYEFIGVDSDFQPPPSRARPSYPHVIVNMKRFANRLAKTGGNPGGLLPPAVHSEFRLRFNQLAKRWPKGSSVNVRSLVPIEIRTQITEANRELAALLGRDLGALGYDI